MEILVGRTKINIIQGDLTKQETEAIVNAANSGLMGGGGVDGAIHRAGGPQILAECKEIIKEQGRLPAGEAVLTTAGDLPAQYVIHTVGPVWRGGNSHEADVLRNAYLNSLKLAQQNRLTSVAFPSISTGAYAYPPKEAASVALGAIIDFINKEGSLDEVRMVLFNEQLYDIYCQACKELLEKE